MEEVKTADREQWSYQSGGDDWMWDGEITVTVRPDGAVLVEVEEEQAVDSYNSMFKCAALLPPKQVAELATLLARAARIDAPLT